jgi:hypothetical protein
LRARLLLWVLLCACATTALAQDANIKRSVAESRKIADQVYVALRDQLLDEMERSGTLRSLIVCKYTCPELILGPSRKTGWKISAVSLKPRNSAMGAPDYWEQKVLTDFDRRVAAGEKADKLETSEIIREPAGKFFRYAKAMPVERLCLECHGTTKTMSEAVRAQLATDYPFDRATGFSVGQVYGIISVKHAL